MALQRRSSLLCGVLASLWLAGCAQQAPAADGGATLAAPSTGAGAFLVGQMATRSGDLAIAADAWSRVLQDDPNNADLLRRTQLTELGAGRFEDAVKAARRLSALNASDPYTLLVLAVDEARGARIPAADALLAQIPAHGVNGVLVPLLRGWLAAGNRDMTAAETFLKPLADNPGFALMRDLHVMLMADYIGDRPRALGVARDILRGDPTPTLRVATLVGAVLERNEAQAEAKTLYGNFRDQAPDSPLPALGLSRLERGETPGRPVAAIQDGLAEGLFDLASLLQRDRPGTELALLLNQMALALRPDFSFAQLLLADIHESQSKPALAVEAFRALGRDPLFGWSARLRLTANLNALGQLDAALDELRAMAAEQPKEDSALIRMGDLLRGHQRWEEAIAAYDQAIQRIGPLNRSHWPLLFSRAICLERAKQVDKAIADLEQALTFEPEQPYMLNYLGYTWVDQGVNLARATAMIEKAVQLRPNDGHIVDSLGWAHYRQGRFADAVIQLERAVELKPVDSTINDHLGDAYWQVGRKLEARHQWARALAMDPEPELKEQIEAKLKGAAPIIVPPAAAKP